MSNKLKHSLSIFLTISLAVLSLTIFFNSYIRIFESIIDLGKSFVIFLGVKIRPSVINDINDNLLDGFFLKDFSIDLKNLLPSKLQNFKIKSKTFIDLFLNKDNFYLYMEKVNKIVKNILPYICLFAPFIYVLKSLVISCYTAENNKTGQTKALKLYNRIMDKSLRPLKLSIKEYVSFLSSKRIYLLIWILILCLSFNVFTILIEYFAFMFYFARSLDFNSLYFQFFKLGKDLTYFIEFWYITLILIFLYIRYLRINYAKKKLYTLELHDRKIINEQPIVTLFEGPMGSGKTQLMTDMALSQDVIFRDKALDIMFSCDLKFPNFEWKRIERMIDYCLHKKILYNLASIDAVMNEITYIFEKSRLTHIYDSIFNRRLKRRYKINTVNFLFDYDYSTYSLYYFNGLYDEYIWDVIKTYAKSYYIYSMSSALLTANYSIRTSNELKKNGKFPLWIDGLFEKYTKKNSMFAHIMDFDSFRLGKKMKKNNNNLAEFGVYAFTEIGKERGNKNELTNVKKGDDEVNQKNDLFNSYIKMIRHLCTIDFYPFAKVFLDEQRNQSLGADARELGDIIRIENKTNKSVLKPNFIFKYIYDKNFETEFRKVTK